MDAGIADDIVDAFHLVSWTYDFYGEHRDINLDLADIEAILKKTEASKKDIEVVISWKRRLARWLFRTADFLPFLILNRDHGLKVSPNPIVVALYSGKSVSQISKLYGVFEV